MHFFIIKQLINVHKKCVEETLFYLFGDKKTEVGN
jgi:hypothetical protein